MTLSRCVFGCLSMENATATLQQQKREINHSVAWWMIKVYAHTITRSWLCAANSHTRTERHMEALWHCSCSSGSSESPYPHTHTHTYTVVPTSGCFPRIAVWQTTTMIKNINKHNCNNKKIIKALRHHLSCVTLVEYWDYLKLI